MIVGESQDIQSNIIQTEGGMSWWMIVGEYQEIQSNIIQTEGGMSWWMIVGEYQEIQSKEVWADEWFWVEFSRPASHRSQYLTDIQ